MLDVYLVPEFPEGHVHFLKYKWYVEYWKDWFGKTRNESKKGFIELIVPKATK
jgi:hypothetical protein